MSTVALFALTLLAGPPAGPAVERGPKVLLSGEAPDRAAWYRKESRLRAQMVFSSVGIGVGGALVTLGAVRTSHRPEYGGALIGAGLGVMALGTAGLSIAAVRETRHTALHTWADDDDGRERQLSLETNLAIFGGVGLSGAATLILTPIISDADYAACRKDHPDPEIACRDRHGWNYFASGSVGIGVMVMATPAIIALGIATAVAHVRRKHGYARLRYQGPGLRFAF